MHDLAARGRNILQIADQLGISRQTVRRYLAAAVPNRPPAAAERPRPLRGLPAPALGRGRHGRAAVARARGHGYAGAYRQVARWAQQRRADEGPRPAAAAGTDDGTRPSSRRDLPTPRQLAWLVVRDPARLTAPERLTRDRIVQEATVALACDLAQRFRALVRERTPDRLEAWLADCSASELRELRSFAAGLRQDHAAVVAALTLPYSTGPAEGHITRLKLIKRQGYGRARIDLLSQRLLATG